MVEAGAITAQCDAIRHRGPDDDAVLVDGDFGFGRRRLSILDLAGAHQPMRTSDGRRLCAITVFGGWRQDARAPARPVVAQAA